MSHEAQRYFMLESIQTAVNDAFPRQRFRSCFQLHDRITNLIATGSEPTREDRMHYNTSIPGCRC